ncbi:MAG: 50S ribosomal protein L40e [Candidatus Micrarchaeia archaeon]
MAGKFPLADKKFLSVKICMKCKARNSKAASRCRKCGGKTLRSKRARKKEGK